MPDTAKMPGSERETATWPGTNQAGDDLRMQALAHAGIGTWQLLLQTDEFSCDETAARLLGAGEAFPRSGNAADLLACVALQDRPDIGVRIQLCSQMGTPIHRSFRRFAQAGVEGWLELTASRVQLPDGQQALIGTLQDITDWRETEDPQKQSGEVLALALESAGAGTWEIRLDEPHLFRLSPAALRMYCLPPDHPGTMTRDEWISLIDPESAADMAGTLDRFIGSTEPHMAEFKVRDLGEGERWLRIHGCAVNGEDGLPEKIVGLIYDDSERKKADEKLRESECLLRLSQEAARIGTFMTEPGGVTIGSEQFFRNLGLPADTGILEHEMRARLYHPEDRDRVRANIDAVIAERQDYHEMEYRIYRADNGEERWMLSRIRPIWDGQGRPLRIAGAHIDITEAKSAALKLRRTEMLNRGIVDSSPDCIMVLDISGRLRFISKRGREALGINDENSLIGHYWPDQWPPEARAHVAAAIADAAQGSTGRFNARGAVRRGTRRWWDAVVSPLMNEHGEITRLLAISRDVTELREQSERIRWAAEHDTLTGLANRNTFDHRLDELIDQARLRKENIGLLALDVDDFKQVNDTLGHDAGDALLKTLATRVRGLLREGDFVARLGGDEFAVVLKDIPDDTVLPKLGERIIAALNQPIPHGGCILDCRVSIGAAIFPQHGNTRDELLKSADTALYAAKSRGRNNILLYESSLRSELDRRSAMISKARSALRADNVEPFYQPQICLRSGQVDGFEALLRWRDKDGALHAPAEIEAAFADLELAHEISERMQDRIIDDMRRWREDGLEFGHVAVNAAAAEFSRNDFASRLLDKLDAARVPANYLQVEVTETVFLGRGADHVGAALQALKARGIAIALDDFGTGYASLSHLKNFPVDVIKIDRSFIRDLVRDTDDTAIVCALLGLAGKLNIKTVAEGIETPEQASFLIRQGCDVGQGYFFGRPLAASSVPDIIARTSRVSA
ncbi:diguanylate cyclase (GGDEF)-like protein/PAS domain S-box-containing protein [Altererythrobacter atlanticus]|uniref:Cyclic di-GMP phosphodiesterase Gmr n=1 Tax=Croceibacterium atlanticum TaxID=1267766 RepID=A0A0F7KTN1_9SPHN|nr:bifunctional diguanylate cyclase/phosphodiesterase [Croceibacterium atlanticum]AKH42501.1 Cyclic di-GMP phosphodiesterase Gmr [Croceibacterium atlanticum]MBB5731278.1 diguanylate cyclase (GGDEF)-like protein/PAS domain S-box-containing protein [Croceibacterium atlanticum]